MNIFATSILVFFGQFDALLSTPPLPEKYPSLFGRVTPVNIFDSLKELDTKTSVDAVGSVSQFSLFNPGENRVGLIQPRLDQQDVVMIEGREAPSVVKEEPELQEEGLVLSTWEQAHPPPSQPPEGFQYFLHHRRAWLGK